MRLLIVDGSNVVMRSALGGELRPDQAAHTASNMIGRCTREFGVTHLVVALDSPAPSWRKLEYPEYKANRTLDTSPWLRTAHAAWQAKRWWVEDCAGWEADDIIATVAGRARDRGEVFVLSGDSDVLPLMEDGIQIIRPVNGGIFKHLSRSDVTLKYGIGSPGKLVDLKAMTGETGDNVPGVSGIGEVRAGMLLSKHNTLDRVIEAGKSAACKYSSAVAAAETTVRLAHRLLTLRRDTPVMAIKPSDCAITP